MQLFSKCVLCNSTTQQTSTFIDYNCSQTVSNCMHEDIKSRPHPRDVCYHSKHTELLFCPLLYTGVKVGLLHLGKKVKLRLFEIRVLRKMYGPKTEEVTADWIQQHNEQFHDLPICVCLFCSATDQLGHRPSHY